MLFSTASLARASGACVWRGRGDWPILWPRSIALEKTKPPMKIVTYSDLHLEFGSGWTLPPEADGDLMILAGDIITFADYRPLDQILRGWRQPAPHVTGNHEYYTRNPLNPEESGFK